jgi:hypothetical protein
MQRVRLTNPGAYPPAPHKVATIWLMHRVPRTVHSSMSTSYSGGGYWYATGEMYSQSARWFRKGALLKADKQKGA